MWDASFWGGVASWGSVVVSLAALGVSLSTRLDTRKTKLEDQARKVAFFVRTEERSPVDGDGVTLFHLTVKNMCDETIYDVRSYHPGDSARQIDATELLPEASAEITRAKWDFTGDFAEFRDTNGVIWRRTLDGRFAKRKAAYAPVVIAPDFI